MNAAKTGTEKEAVSRCLPEIGEVFNPYLYPEIRRTVRGCKGLSVGAKVTFEALSDRAGKNGKCYPSMRTLGADIGVMRRQAQRYCEELAASGLLRTSLGVDGKGRQRSNIFEFVYIDLDKLQRLSRNRKRKVNATGASDVTPQKVPNVTRGRASDVTPKRSNRERSQLTKQKTQKADTSLRIAEKRDSQADVSLPSASKPKLKPKPRLRTNAEYDAMEEFLGEHPPTDTEEWPGGRADGIPQHWMTQATLNAAPFTHAGEILQFLESKMDSGWCPPNWAAYPAIVRHEFERRDNRAQGKHWSDSDLAAVRSMVTSYMEGEPPPPQFEHSCELRANGATARDVVALLERKRKNKKFRLGSKHGPGAVSGQRSRWNWFLKVIGAEFSETERAHLPELPAVNIEPTKEETDYMERACDAF